MGTDHEQKLKESGNMLKTVYDFASANQDVHRGPTAPLADRLMGVQPLFGPTGSVYYLRFRYISNKEASGVQPTPSSRQIPEIVKEKYKMQNE